MRTTEQAGAEQAREEPPGRSSGATSDRPAHEHSAYEHLARGQIVDAAPEAERLTGLVEEPEDSLLCGVTFRFARMVGGFFLIGIGIALLPYEVPGWLTLCIGVSLLCFPETLRWQDPANSAILSARIVGASILIGNGIAFLPYDGPGWMTLYIGLSLLPFPKFPQKLRWQDPASSAERFDAEPTACVQCSANIPAGQDKCPQCGWTYKE